MSIASQRKKTMGKRAEDYQTHGAIFSRDEVHRYVLWRRWTDSRNMVTFVGLNPSTADAVKNDPTVTRCINYAKSWGYGGMFMLNAFAFRATDPQVMRSASDPVGCHNDGYILDYARRSKAIIACWGNHGSFQGRSRALVRLLRRFPLLCLGTTNQGEPKHPLYLSRTTKPILWLG